MTFKHSFKHFVISEERDTSNELIKAYLYSKSNEFIAELSNLYFIEFINDEITIITTKINNILFTFIFKEENKKINITKFILISTNIQFNSDEAYIKLDDHTLAINKNGLYYLYDLTSDIFISDGFNKIEKQDDMYIGYYYIFIDEIELCITVYMDNRGRVIDNLIYINELNLKIKYFYNLQNTIKVRWKLINNALNNKRKENAKLTRKRP